MFNVQFTILTSHHLPAAGCAAVKESVWTVEAEVCFSSPSPLQVRNPPSLTLCVPSSEALSPRLPSLLPPCSSFFLTLLTPVEDAAPSATLPRRLRAQIGLVPERCHSLGDLSRSPTTGRKAPSYAASSSADVSPLRSVLTRRMTTCPHGQRHPQPLHASTCTVLLEQPLCSPFSLWHIVSK